MTSRRGSRGTRANEQKARRLVYARAGGRCEGCFMARPTDFSHRINRSQGGPWTAENGMHMCRPCHSWIGDQPLAAQAKGWHLESWQNPLTEPVLLRTGRVWLTPIGTYSSTAPLEVTP